MAVLQRDFLPADASKVFEKNHVDGCVAVQADQSDQETHFLVELARKNAFIKGVVGWVDFTASDLQEKLQAYSSEPLLKGFREIIQGCPDEQYFTNKKFLEGIGRLIQFEYRYDILIAHHQLPSAIRFSEKYPDQHFILDHIAKPDIKSGDWKKWKTDMKELAANPRIHCKLSGMVTEADWRRWRNDQIMPYLEIAAECFGTSRVCFGSDWPVCLLAGNYEQVLKIVTSFLSQVSEIEKEQVLSGNISSFYKLN
jgi:L-fuconolactonase